MNIVRQNPLQRLGSIQYALSRARLALSETTDTAASGLQVTRPSDAPGRWTQISGLAAASEQHVTWRENAGRAIPIQDVADTALNHSTDLMVRAREIAIQMSSETWNDTDRADAAGEVDSLRAELLRLANTDVAGRFVFAGSAYDAAAYDATGTYQGDNGAPATQIGQGTTTPTGFDGSAWFDDAFVALDALRTALASGPGSATAVAAQLDGLDAAQRQMVRGWQSVGRERASLDDAMEVSQALDIEIQEGLSGIVAADPLETLSRLTQLQTSYQAALQVSAGALSGRRLFDFLQ